MSQGQGNRQQIRVLLVENLYAMRGILIALLKDLGYQQITHAIDGLEALDKLKRKHFDIIISDWEMPRMNGLTLLKKVRKDPKSADIPFILVSGIVEYEQVRLAVRFGVSEYLVKPFTEHLLEQKIQHSLRTSARPQMALSEATVPPRQAFASKTITFLQDSKTARHVAGNGFGEMVSAPSADNLIATINRDKTIDVVVTEDGVLRGGSSASEALLKLAKQGIVDVVAIGDSPADAEALEVYKGGEHVNFMPASMVALNLSKLIQQLQTLKKALLDSKRHALELKKDNASHRKMYLDLIIQLRERNQEMTEAGAELARLSSGNKRSTALKSTFEHNMAMTERMLKTMEVLTEHELGTGSYDSDVIDLSALAKAVESDNAVIIDKRHIGILFDDSVKTKIITTEKLFNELFTMVLLSMIKEADYNSDIKVSAVELADQKTEIKIQGSFSKKPELKDVITADSVVLTRDQSVADQCAIHFAHLMGSAAVSVHFDYKETQRLFEAYIICNR